MAQKKLGTAAVEMPAKAQQRRQAEAREIIDVPQIENHLRRLAMLRVRRQQFLEQRRRQLRAAQLVAGRSQDEDFAVATNIEMTIGEFRHASLCGLQQV